jgi:hypothetical protein
VHFRESENFEGTKNPLRGGGRFTIVHKKSRKVEIKYGKLPMTPAKSEDRAKSRKCSFLDDHRLLVV